MKKLIIVLLATPVVWAQTPTPTSPNTASPNAPPSADGL